MRVSPCSQRLYLPSRLFCLFYISKFWFWEKIWKLGMKNITTAEQSLEKILKIAISCIPALGIWMLSIKTVGTDEDSSCWRQDTADGSNRAMSTCLVSLCQSLNIPGLLLQLSRRSFLWNIYMPFFLLILHLNCRFTSNAKMERQNMCYSQSNLQKLIYSRKANSGYPKLIPKLLSTLVSLADVQITDLNIKNSIYVYISKIQGTHTLLIHWQDAFESLLSVETSLSNGI